MLRCPPGNYARLCSAPRRKLPLRGSTFRWKVTPFGCTWKFEHCAVCPEGDGFLRKTYINQPTMGDNHQQLLKKNLPNEKVCFVFFSQLGWIFVCCSKICGCIQPRVLHLPQESTFDPWRTLLIVLSVSVYEGNLTMGSEATTLLVSICLALNRSQRWSDYDRVRDHLVETGTCYQFYPGKALSKWRDFVSPSAYGHSRRSH